MIASVVEVKSAIIAVPVFWNGDDVSCYGNSSNDGKYRMMLAFGMPSRTLLLCVMSIKGDESSICIPRHRQRPSKYSRICSPL